jgi:hypothetical protein
MSLLIVCLQNLVSRSRMSRSYISSLLVACIAVAGHLYLYASKRTLFVPRLMKIRPAVLGLKNADRQDRCFMTASRRMNGPVHKNAVRVRTGATHKTVNNGVSREARTIAWVTVFSWRRSESRSISYGAAEEQRTRMALRRSPVQLCLTKATLATASKVTDLVIVTAMLMLCCIRSRINTNDCSLWNIKKWRLFRRQPYSEKNECHKDGKNRNERRIMLFINTKETGRKGWEAHEDH